MAAEPRDSMDFDRLQQVWRDQPLPSAQAKETEMIEQAIAQARRFERHVLIRDIVEVTVSILAACLFGIVGLQVPTFWPWLVAASLVLFVGAYFIGDRIRQRRKEARPSESVRSSLETSLERVEHQIWLLRRVGWWYLAPCFAAGLSISLGVGFDAVAELQDQAGTFVAWVAGLSIAMVGALVMAVVCWGIYRLNQKAVDRHLIPQRESLAALLGELEGRA